MVVWYIGAARGPGNPYGIAAATVSPSHTSIRTGEAYVLDGLHRSLPILADQLPSSAAGFLCHDPSHHRCMSSPCRDV